MRIGIIGAGMAGLSCANALSALGHDVELFDKGRGAGGRMSTRRIETALGSVCFDHGAQYFTARDRAFQAQVEAWAVEGHVIKWPLPGGDAWIGTPAMNSVVKAMARPHRVHWGCEIVRIEQAQSGWALGAADASFAGFDAVILAIPAEQATPFLSLHDFAMARQSMLARSQPCWTAMFVFADPLPMRTEVVRNSRTIGWASRNAAKPEYEGPDGWVVQANADWSRRHIEDTPAHIAGALLDALGVALDQALPPPISATAHRWRYAMSGGLGLGALWNPGLGLGVCGDWLLGPRVECAWLSGQQLAWQIAEVHSQLVE